MDDAATPTQNDKSNKDSPWALVVRESESRQQDQPHPDQRQKKHGELQRLKAETQAETIRPKNPKEWTEEYKQRRRNWQNLVENRGAKCDCAWHSPDPAQKSNYQKCLFIEEPFGLEPSYGRPMDDDAAGDARAQAQGRQKWSLEEAAYVWQEQVAEKSRSYHLTEAGLEEGRQRDLRRLKEATRSLNPPPNRSELEDEVKSNWSDSS
jgi:hypothetical protein